MNVPSAPAVGATFCLVFVGEDELLTSAEKKYRDLIAKLVLFRPRLALERPIGLFQNRLPS